MLPKKPSSVFALLLTSALCLCALLGTGSAHDEADNSPSHEAYELRPEVSPSAKKPGRSEMTMVELTLGGGPAETIVVRQGATVRLVLHAPAGTQLHLHGYDLAATAVDGSPIVMTFHAAHSGRFSIEAHGEQDALGRTEKVLAYFEVRPE